MIFQCQELARDHDQIYLISVVPKAVENYFAIKLGERKASIHPPEKTREKEEEKTKSADEFLDDLIEKKKTFNGSIFKVVMEGDVRTIIVEQTGRSEWRYSPANLNCVLNSCFER